MPNSKSILEALLPQGSLWIPQPEYDFDRLLNGIGDSTDNIVNFLNLLSETRNPMLTPFLDSLEIDYGILPNNKINETIRRSRLYAVKTKSDSEGTAEWIQEAFRTAGFNITIHTNDPAVDPASILTFDTSVVFGEPGNQFGESPDQFVAVGSSDLLVNGAIKVNQTLVTYSAPPAEYFSQIWFIGGAGNRDENGYLTSLDWAQVLKSRKNEFISMILKYKPVNTWVGLKVEYI